MKNFFLRVRDSVYSPVFYTELRNRPFSFSVKYFVLFALTLAFVASVVVGLRYGPALRDLLAELGPQMIANYPDELVIDINAGKVSVNVSEPYAITMPERLAALLKDSGQGVPAKLLTIDTTRDFSVEQFNAYGTLAWLTKDTLVYRSEQGNVQIAVLGAEVNERVDKQSIVLIMENLKPAFAFAVPLFLVMSFLLAVLLSALKLVYLFLGALFIYLLARVRKTELSYKQSYQWGLHALTLPMLVNLALFFAGASVPFLFTAILLLVTWFNLASRAS